MSKLHIRQLMIEDIEQIVDSFESNSWNKPKVLFESYFKEQSDGQREVLVGWLENQCVGYLTILWEPNYSSFKESNIPEISDLNILPDYRKQKLATKLMDKAESIISSKNNKAGIGVGMYPDYGNAQRMYVKRGYIPDGNGLTYKGKILEPLEQVTNDDDLVLYFTKKL